MRSGLALTDPTQFAAAISLSGGDAPDAPALRHTVAERHANDLRTLAGGGATAPVDLLLAATRRGDATTAYRRQSSPESGRARRARRPRAARAGRAQLRGLDADDAPGTGLARRAVAVVGRPVIGARCHDVPMEISRTIVVLDAADLNAVSTFWAGLLGGTVTADDDWHTVLVDGDPRIGVQLAPNHVRPAWPDGEQQQIHLDLYVADIRARPPGGDGARCAAAAGG